MDSRLHSRRRIAAQRRLWNTRPRSILFICHGNICRSPFAAAVFSQLVPPALKATVVTTSAGFVGPGRSSPVNALDTARTYGIDMSSHSSSVITSENLKAADLIVVMSAAQARGISARVGPNIAVLILGDLDPDPIEKRTILDPWDGPVEDFEASYARIRRCVAELVGILWDAREFP